MSYEYSVDALVAAHTAFRDLVDAQTGDATVAITDDAGTVLGAITLGNPSGAVDALTGQLTFSDDGTTHDAVTDGTATWAEIKDGAGGVHLTLPVIPGTQALTGFCVINTTSISSGAPIVLEGLVIG